MVGSGAVVDADGELSGAVLEGGGDDGSATDGSGLPGVSDSEGVGDSRLDDGLGLADSDGRSHELSLIDGLPLGDGLGLSTRLARRLSHTLSLGNAEEPLGEAPRIRLGVVGEPLTSRKAMSRRSTCDAWPFSHGSGLVNRPLTITSKWRWHPVE